MAVEQDSGSEARKERSAELQPIDESREQALLAVEHIVRVEEKISKTRPKSPSKSWTTKQQKML